MRSFFATLLIGVVAANAYTWEYSDRSGSLSQLCDYYGHSDKSDEAQIAPFTYLRCLYDSVITDDMKERVEEVNRYSNYTKQAAMMVMGKFCQEKASVAKCHNDYFDSVAPCLDPKWDKEYAKTNVVKMIDYVCYNNAERILEIVLDDVLTCIDDQRRPLLDCLSESDKFDAASHMPVTELCDKYNKLSDCVVASFSKCPKKSIGEFMKRIARIAGQGQCNPSADAVDKNTKLQ